MSELLRLDPIRGAVVYVPAMGDYWILMNMFELAGWKCKSGRDVLDYSRWYTCGNHTCITAGIDLCSGDVSVFGHGRLGFYLDAGMDILTFREACFSWSVVPGEMREVRGH